MGVGAAELWGGSGTGSAGAQAPGGFDFLDPGAGVAALSPWQLFWRRFRQDRVALVSFAFIVFLVDRRDRRPADRETARPARAECAEPEPD